MTVHELYRYYTVVCYPSKAVSDKTVTKSINLNNHTIIQLIHQFVHMTSRQTQMSLSVYKKHRIIPES